MYFRKPAVLFLFSMLAVAHPTAIPNNLQSPRPYRRSDNLIVARQPKDEFSTSSASTKTLTAIGDASNITASRTAATSSPLLAPEHKNHNVAIGFNGTSFTPTALKSISIGDAITFYFYPRNFSIVQSTFSHPCNPITGDVNQHSIFSGFDYDSTSGISLNKFVVNVTTTDPIWLYGYDGNAADGGDVCQRGMAMVVNPLPKDPANGQTLKAYIKSANAVALNIEGTMVEKVPRKIYGGEKVSLTARQKQLWEARHPQGKVLSLDDINDYGVGAGVNGTSPGKQIASFQGDASRGSSVGTVLTGLVVSIVAAVLGLIL